jgi:hypothetical protein
MKPVELGGDKQTTGSTAWGILGEIDAAGVPSFHKMLHAH